MVKNQTLTLPTNGRREAESTSNCHDIIIILDSTLYNYWCTAIWHFFHSFSALTLLVGWQEGHLPVKTELWGAGVVICLKQGADLHLAQLMPMPLIVSCFSKIQIGFTFLVPAHPGSPGHRAVKRVCAIWHFRLISCCLAFWH